MYVVSQDKKSGAWYCHMKGYDYIPVLGSVGDRRKAEEICRLYNSSIGKGCSRRKCREDG